MSKQVTLRTPQAVTGELDISPATLRRWADEFSNFLSPEANSAQGKSHRRYTDEDVEILQIIKELMNSGLTYQQVHQRLGSTIASPSDSFTLSSEAFDDFVEDDFEEESEPAEAEESEESTALITSNGNESPAIAFLTNTLTTLSDTQQTILNSQAANRELIGVLIQDNFNLKEENNRLRERILEIERSLAQSRQEDEWRRESLRQELDAKITSAQQQANQAINVAQSIELPEIKAVKNKPGCLGALFGGGDTQIVTVPRRRKQEGQERPTTGPHHPSAPPPSTQSSSAPIHPKPTLPPE